MLAAYIAGLGTPILVLDTSGTTFGPNTVLGDIVQPTGSWYTAPVATFGTQHIGADGKPTVATACYEFAYSGTDPGEQITGAAIIDTTPTPDTVIAGWNFTPVMMATVDDVISVQGIIKLPLVPQLP